ncbi:pentatricopeptide repeat-containing protein At1g66345, mitochondrial isoform X1 [Morus notabilis]|uniref:pentatricopeptide repeat-containing protein At1g66345, mitochondrial isoform X1 n=2 Tax=Morus notabilis TaxID=981085 RepID=UPI000CED5531|nr:pentatricopeptide repeat-containing protein At1g66345, mitochondrial isoform X1 [Morus notabilis]
MDMSLLRQIVPSLIFKSLKSPWQLCCFNPRSEPSHLIHTVTKPIAPNNVVKAICNAFRSGWTWDTLSREFHHIEFNEQLIEKILLELKQPIDAKWALGFFHWAAHRVNFQHCLRSYCLAIHILVRARLNLDARALIETVLKKNAGDSSKFLVVDSLLSCYKITDSTPFVFDLLVQSYSRLRMFDSGFDVCCYLEEHGFSLNLVSFNTFIHVVEKSDENTMVWRIYEHMIWRRIYPNQSTIRTLISSLCKEGKLQKYVEMLDRIHGRRCSPSVIVNTSLVFKIFEEGRVEEGVVLLKRMLQRNMLFDTIAYSLIVYAKLKLGNIVSAQDVYEEMLKRGFRANPFVYTLFIRAYCKEGRIDETHCMMKDMEDMGLKPYEETYNSLVECYAKAGRLEESLRNCEVMMEKGFVPSCAAFNEMVHKLCENGEAEKANAMLTRLLEKGFSPNDITYASLIVGYEKKGDVEEVLKLFYEMVSKSISPGSLVFTTLIKSLCRSGKLEQAEKYLRIMKDRKIVLLQSVSTKGSS